MLNISNSNNPVVFLDTNAHINATCRIKNGKCQCSCNDGYSGDGAQCSGT